LRKGGDMVKKLLLACFAIFVIASTNDPSWALSAQSPYIFEISHCGVENYIREDGIDRLDQDVLKITGKGESFSREKKNSPGIIKKEEDPFAEFFRMSMELNRCL
jgi:hypothetical protein